MSFDLAVFYSTSPLNAETAAHRYQALCERSLDDPHNLKGLVEPNPSVTEFLAEMTALYPPLSEVADDEDDLSPWSCAPDVSEGHVIVSIRWSRCGQMTETLTALALRHGLTVYDPQSNRVLGTDSAQR